MDRSGVEEKVRAERDKGLKRSEIDAKVRERSGVERKVRG